MPRGPKGEKRPADVIGAAVMVGRIATGEIDESTPAPDAAVGDPLICQSLTTFSGPSRNIEINSQDRAKPNSR
jgi:hypothetical protein